MRRRIRAAGHLAGLAVCTTLAGCAGTEPGAQTVTLTPSADATLFAESGTKGDGAGAHLFAGCNGRGEPRRALLRFDLGSLPAGTTIANAELVMTVDHTGSGPTAVRLHRLQENWGEGAADAQGMGQGTAATEGDATWTHRTLGGAAWSRPGGTIEAEPAGETTVAGTGAYVWSSPRLLEQVRLWLRTPADNHGWAVVGNEAGQPSAKRFGSRQHGDPANRPRLVLTLAPR